MTDYKNICASCGISEGELSSLNFGKRFHVNPNYCIEVINRKNKLLQSKIENHILHIKDLIRERDNLQQIVNTVKYTDAQGVWYWIGKGDDPESLSCPIVMLPDTLSLMLDKISKLEKIIEILR